MIRHAIAADAFEIARIQRDSWRATYQGVIWQQTLDRLSVERGAQGWLRWFLAARASELCLVATDETNPGRPGCVVGYAMAGMARKVPPKFGRAEIQVLYLAPAHQGKGLGRQLVATSATGLEKRGFQSMEIWSLAKNPSRQFYDRLGGVVTDTRQTQVSGQHLDENCYFWPSLAPLAAMRGHPLSTNS